MDPHSFFADPDPAVHLNADLDPAAFFKIKIKISTNFLEFFQFFLLKFFSPGSGRSGSTALVYSIH